MSPTRVQEQPRNNHKKERVGRSRSDLVRLAIPNSPGVCDAAVLRKVSVACALPLAGRVNEESER